MAAVELSESREPTPVNTNPIEATVQEDVVKPPEKLLEDMKGKKYFGGLPTVDQIVDIRRLWGIEGLNKADISRLVKISGAVVNECTRGVPKGKPPGGAVTISQTTKTFTPREPQPIVNPPPPIEQPIAQVITSVAGPSQEVMAKLYYLAVSRQCRSIDEFIEAELIPWYGIKMDWEWKTSLKKGQPQRVTCEQFSAFLDKCVQKSFKYDDMARKFVEELEPDDYTRTGGVVR